MLILIKYYLVEGINGRSDVHWEVVQFNITHTCYIIHLFLFFYIQWIEGKIKVPILYAIGFTLSACYLGFVPNFKLIGVQLSEINTS